jgi:hypothetical protein
MAMTPEQLNHLTAAVREAFPGCRLEGDPPGRIVPTTDNWPVGIHMDNALASHAEWQGNGDAAATATVWRGIAGSMDDPTVEIRLGLLNGMFDVQVERLGEDSFQVGIRARGGISGEVGLLAAALRHLADQVEEAESKGKNTPANKSRPAQLNASTNQHTRNKITSLAYNT